MHTPTSLGRIAGVGAGKRWLAVAAAQRTLPARGVVRAAISLCLFGLLLPAGRASAAEMSVGSLAIASGETSAVVVSGVIAGESTFGLTILVELIPRAGSTGTVTFTPSPPADITQAGDPWPGAGMFDAFDTDAPGLSLTLNGSVDDNGTFLNGAVTFTGALSSFPVVASANASGIWDVVLSTLQGDSNWQGLATTLTPATITVSQLQCTIPADCDDGVFCNGTEDCVGNQCIAGGDPCPGRLCDEAATACVDCLSNTDCDDGLFCSGTETCSSGTCLPGADPCPGQTCDETGGVCTNCLVDADCNDGLFCTGIETCVSNSCVAGSDPCPTQVCDEATMACLVSTTSMSVGNLTMAPGATDALVVSGNIDGESTFGVTILAEISPRAGNTGTITFTPSPPPDITQAGDPWPGAGMFDSFDTDVPGLSLTLNGSVDDNGTFLNGSVTFTGPLSSFPVIASADATGVWDVMLSTSQGNSSWEGLATTLIAGTITISLQSCTLPSECDDGVFCNGPEGCVGNLCTLGSDPCPGRICDETGDVCVDCLVDGDCDDALFCTGVESCLGSACLSGTDPCLPQVCDEPTMTCLPQPATLSVSDEFAAPGEIGNVVVSGNIDGQSTFSTTIFVELVPRSGSVGTITFTSSPPTDIVQLTDPWSGVGIFGPFDTDTTGSALLNGATIDNGTLVSAPVTFTGDLAGFPFTSSADAGGVWDVVLATSAGDSTWEGVSTTLTIGTITIAPTVSLSVGSFAIPPGGTADAIVFGEVQDQATFGVTVLLELRPRAGTVGFLTFTPAPPTDIVQVGDPFPSRGTFTTFDTDAAGLTDMLNGFVDDNGSFLSEQLTFAGDLARVPVVASAGASGVWDITLSTSLGASSWEGLTTVLVDGTIGVSTGACITAIDCDDNNVCTSDSCNRGICEHTNVPGSCEDATACTVGDVCVAGVCISGGIIDCSMAGDQCNTASCDAFGLEGNCAVFTPITDGSPCNDGDACLLGETCQLGVCGGGLPPDCTSFSDDCNVASCDAAGLDGNCDTITPVADGTVCDDGLTCNVGETCSLGVCTAGSPADCSMAALECQVASCDVLGVEGNCDIVVGAADGSLCDDGDPCNINESCVAGVCMGGGLVDCSTAAPECATASCDIAGGEGNCDTITQLPDGTVCEDGLFCTGPDLCSAGVCITGGDPCPGQVCDESLSRCFDCLVAADCDDGNPCTDDTCVIRSCLNTFSNLSCQDGDVCTLNDVCVDGACQAGSPVDCSALGDQCNTAACDPAGLLGNCDLLTPVATGTLCNDGDPCRENDSCQSGTCIGVQLDCSVFDDTCNAGVCNPANGLCQAQPANEGGACNDGLPCTTSDACVSGVCEGSLIDVPSVGLRWSPLAQSSQVGQTVSLDLIAVSETCADQPVASIEAIVTWDPTTLQLLGIRDFVGTPWSGSGFPNDSGLDGLNSPFLGVPDNDGSVLYQALGDFSIGVDVPPGGVMVTTFDFLTLDGSFGTPIAISLAAGSFTRTRVLATGAFGVDITGMLGGAAVQISECVINIDCDDANVCTTDACGAGVCNFTNNILPCDDGLFCTQSDVCGGGTCLGSVDPCLPAALCSESLDSCVECLSPADCDDGNVCTDDVCTALGVCQNPSNTLPCDDGLFCTAVDVCSANVCVGGGITCPGAVCDEPNDRCVECLTNVDCDDSNLCTNDVCTNNVCSHPVNTLPCDDGLFCTTTDVCSGGACIGSTDPCTSPLFCNENTNACAECLVNAHCDDGNPCTFDDCFFSVCRNLNNSLPCDDGLFCTTTDVCQGGACIGSGDACPVQLCDESGSQCVECFTVADCVDDGLPCTLDQCLDSVCVHDPIDANCDDGLFCNGAEFCSPIVGCVTPGSTCDDANLCDELNDACGCRDPVVAGEGARFLSVTPRAGIIPVALLVTGVDFGVNCVSQYVQRDGTLGPNPVFRTPTGPDGWATAHVRGIEIRPSTSYAVQTECDTGGRGLDRSVASLGTTWAWGDADNSGLPIDVVDIVIVLDGFKGKFVVATPFSTDMWGNPDNVCLPDLVVAISDVVVTLEAFKGFIFPCAAPCP